MTEEINQCQSIVYTHVHTLTNKILAKYHISALKYSIRMSQMWCLMLDIPAQKHRG